MNRYSSNFLNMEKQTARLHSNQAGMSLVELMVASTIGIILMAGLIQIFTANKYSYQLQESLNGIQENGRYAMNSISRSLRMADHWGGVEADVVDTGAVATNITGIGGCDAAWITSVLTGVRGYEGAANIGAVAGFPANCIAASDYVPDSDILVVRYAQPEAVTAGALFDNTVFLRTAVGETARLIVGSAGVPADLPNQDGTYNFPYKVDIYYLRTCSVKDAGGNCQDTIPTMVRMTLESSTTAGSGTTLVEQELAENIEQLQFMYGRDLINNDGNVDRYDAADVAIANGLSMTDWWARVIDVRTSLVARSEKKDGSYNDGTAYTLNNYNYTVAAADQNYRRKEYTRVIQIRNRNRQ